MKFIYLFLIIFIQYSWTSIPEKLEFTDEKGDIIYSSQDLLVRFIEVTDSEDPEEIESLIYFEADPDYFFYLLTNVSLYPKYLSQYREVILIEQDENSRTWDVYLEIFKLMFNYRIKHIYESKYHFRWEYVKGDIKDTRGGWNVYKVDRNNGSFYVKYNQIVDLGFYFPQWVLRRIGLASIKDVISNIRERVTNKLPNKK